MRVFLKKGDELKEQGSVLNTANVARYQSTKKPVKSGSWYFECSHFNGSNTHLCGFSNSCGIVIFYPERSIDQPQVYVEGCLSSNGSIIRTVLPFSIDDKHTVGVGIDIDNHSLTVFYNENFFTYSYQKVSKSYSYDILVGGGNIPRTEDYMSVNLGALPFTYHIGGFKSWESGKESFCTQAKIKNNHNFQIITLLIILINK